MTDTVSSKILERLLKGKESLGNEAREYFEGYIKSQLLDDQSFKDKAGKSDLYYTLFGWTLCYVFKIKLDTKKMIEYLNTHKKEELDLIHYAALKRCYLIYQLIKMGKVITGIGLLKKQNIKPLSEFISVPNQDIYAPYTQYIWMLLTEDTGNKISKDVVSNLENYHIEKGGYKNSESGVHASANATAAALSVLGQLKGYDNNEDLIALKAFQNPTGGFSAAKNSPVPDLLSTATALFVLSCYGEKPNYPVMDFIEAHWSESGGFVGTIMDDKSDVEYCFYGLLALGCL
ncbi:prenyltransferase/squalene oxidase repeat-containing protein [Plebeiibacterium sediminum]|uniref:Prenyltransferase alpha-alpha toroid domain-containing protein n=1 Tax=Plebeiibacterium sediminum TaxID=2992112 RepID=A0AAE3SDE0_9BACT|nr:prenyltransferase/squalene oxidase repeat-containing protein [Plebeiobacterium sediminum]MCW3785263.1 hypothetical protein [Plebeiobacterium sediminum]